MFQKQNLSTPWTEPEVEITENELPYVDTIAEEDAHRNEVIAELKAATARVVAALKEISDQRVKSESDGDTNA